jgi:hypothetical protein
MSVQCSTRISDPDFFTSQIRIHDPRAKKHRIPDPGAKKALDPGSATLVNCG